MTELLTTKQVQGLLRVDRTTIYRMVEGGHLPAVRVGKQWRFARGDVERWLESGRSHAFPLHADVALHEAVRETGALTAEVPSAGDLASSLPLACAQLIQDAFADLLGVTMLVTDIQGRPVTQISNPCAFFKVLTGGNPLAIDHCVATWQQMAGTPALEPRFIPNEMGLLCARGLIRMGAELKGMVVIGGIAPEVWPPGPEDAADLAALFGKDPEDIMRCAGGVFRLDRATQDRALRSVQRIADIFSHILEDRAQLFSSLEATRSLLQLGTDSRLR